MVLWVSRWACMLFSLSAEHSLRAPASAPYLSWDRPLNPKKCVLLSTSFSYLLFKRPLLCCDVPSLRSWTKNMPASPVISSSLSSFCAAIAIEVPCTGPLRSFRRPPPLLLLLLLLVVVVVVVVLLLPLLLLLVVVVPPLCRCHRLCHCTCLPQIYV